MFFNPFSLFSFSFPWTALLSLLTLLPCSMAEPFPFGPCVARSLQTSVIGWAPLDLYCVLHLPHILLLVHSKRQAHGRGQSLPFLDGTDTATTGALCCGTETLATLLCYIDHLLNLFKVHLLRMKSLYRLDINNLVMIFQEEIGWVLTLVPVVPAGKLRTLLQGHKHGLAGDGSGLQASPIRRAQQMWFSYLWRPEALPPCMSSLCWRDAVCFADCFVRRLWFCCYVLAFFYLPLLPLILIYTMHCSGSGKSFPAICVYVAAPLQHMLMPQRVGVTRKCVLEMEHFHSNHSPMPEKENYQNQKWNTF